jgi:hypothetical protein
MQAIYIKCFLFEKVFYYDSDIKEAHGSDWNQQTNEWEMYLQFINDEKITFSCKEKPEWIYLKDYKTQINEIIKG